jgi:hypothetical protein
MIDRAAAAKLLELKNRLKRIQTTAGDVTTIEADVADLQSDLATFAAQLNALDAATSGTNTGDQTTITGNAGTATNVLPGGLMDGVALLSQTNVVTGITGKIFTPAAWVAVSGGVGFLNSWVNYGGSEQTARFRKSIDGFVHLDGVIKNGTLSNTAFFLPAGYLPATNKYFSINDNGAIILCLVASSGAVVPLGGNTAVGLEGISYYTD